MRRDIGLNVGIGIFALLAAVFFTGCLDPVLSAAGTPPNGTAAGTNVLVVRIAGESPARTALPAVPKSAKYTISVGGKGGATVPQGSGVYPIQLTAAPAAEDVVTVKSFDDSGTENASGTYTLKAEDLRESGIISVILSPLLTETGNIELKVSFDSGTGTDKINYAHHYLYTSSNYKMGGLPMSQLNHQFPGEGPQTISISRTGLTPGDYVLKIEFERGNTKVSRLLQAVNVRGGLTTNTWVESGSNTLNWNVFASSNAELAGIAIDGTSIARNPNSPYEYNLYTPTTSIPDSMTLNVTAGEPGQVITAYLNKSGTAVPLTSVDHTFTHTFTGLGLKNSFDVTVTAPDGITKRDYYVNITGKEIIGFYFEFNGNGKYYGIKTDTPDAEANSGSISGDAITVNVPYRYGTELINNMPEITASGNSFSPQDSWGTNLTSRKEYTITAVDGTTRDYLVTVNVAEPIYVTGSLESEDEITFSKGEVPSTTDDTLIILIDNNDSFTGWNIGIKSGNDTINTYSTHTFDAPSAPGSYNVTVEVSGFTEDGGLATGSFTLVVE